MSEEDNSYSTKLKFWRLDRGAHKLKNRSSKNILRLAHFNKNKIWKCMSNEFLNELAKNGSFDATQEINRRNRKREKRENKLNK